MKLSKKLLIYPAVFSSLYLYSSPQTYSQSGAVAANYAAGNFGGRRCHGKNCKNLKIDTFFVKNKIDSLEKLMADKEAYCLDDPYKKHECKKDIHLNVNQIKSELDSLEKLMATDKQFHEENVGRLIDTTGGKVALGFTCLLGFSIIGMILFSGRCHGDSC